MAQRHIKKTRKIAPSNGVDTMAQAYTDETFTFYADPGHAWLKVGFGDLAAVGLEAAKDFSECSYWFQSKNYKAYVYLEEDCDAAIFLAAYYGKHKALPKLKHSNSDGRSKIRGFNRLPRGARFEANMKAAYEAVKEVNAA